MSPMFNFLLALTAVLAAAMANAAIPVLDIDGDPIVPGGSYYVLPAVFGVGGGLGLHGKQCPLNIVQSPSEVDNGFPVKFSNWRSRVGFVPESENLNIETVAATICVQQTYWWLDETIFVTTGPKPEVFSEDSSKSFFQIKKSDTFGGFAYKFEYCLSEDSCIGIGILLDDKGIRRLATREYPLSVVFIKSGEGSSKTMSII